MDRALRDAFNAAYTDALYARLRARLEGDLGPIPFPLAETPLFVDRPLRELLVTSAREITAQLSAPALIATMKRSVPPHYDVPHMTAQPDCVQVDFALVDVGGTLVPRLIELQAFPSLYAFETLLTDAWNEVLDGVPGLRGTFTCMFDEDRAASVARVGRAILGGEDPREVVLVDFAPVDQKTAPDFAATKKLFGVDAVCVTDLVKDGRTLYRDVDGKRVRVKRIYNRMVFDELEVKRVRVPFAWTDDLDVTWCSHPNWYWTWSKFSLPFLDHPSVPRARLVSALDAIPDDLSGYVLKPLFSFAGAGVVVDVTRANLDAIPERERASWMLQEKVVYAPAVRAPDGADVKAEVRMMMVLDPATAKLDVVLPLVRMSRGKLLGVDHNKGLKWVGGSVGLWLK